MKWIEIRLNVDGEAAEAVVELLSRYGHQGVSVEQDGIMPEMYDDGAVPPAERLIVRAYLPDDERATAAKEQLEFGLRLLNMMYPMPTPEYVMVDEQDWAEAWKVHYHPIRLGKRILIRPLWVELEPEPNDIHIALDPGMAFGTGTHPTTQLCLEALEDVVTHGIKVLDLGSGSGILAIAAAKLGASDILALDNDPVAVKSSIENIKVNGVDDKITAQEGSLETVIHSARRFDLIVVNILARIIIQMCSEGLGDIVRPGGLAIFSGLTFEQVEDVENALRGVGLIPYKRRQQPDGDWMVVECKRPHQN
ncbi:MAG TPA: 50S ribosomal protein L11 methyltransferase [Aggregatilineales bacterium]|nr:50S ribosomal protein L11 methyltransferase [Aggregatilineales bacterium]